MNPNRHWTVFESLSLCGHTRPDLEALLAMFETNPDIKGVKSLIRDIKIWLKACTESGIKTVRSHKCKHACSLMIEYLRRKKLKWLFSKEQDCENSVMRASYCAEITYYPPNRDKKNARDAYIEIELFYTLFDNIQNANVYIQERESLGHTAEELFSMVGLFAETDELLADYAENNAKYEQIYNKIGSRFLAVGIGSNTGIDGNSTKRSRRNRFDSDIDDFDLGAHGPSRVVIDFFQEEDTEKHTSRHAHYSEYFWDNKINLTDEDEHGEMILEDDPNEDDKNRQLTQTHLDAIQIPTHPYVVVFDLKSIFG